MDIFQTTVTAGELILRFILSCAEFSSDAKSLSARFGWDLRLLNHFLEFFQKRQRDNGGELSPNDKELLNKSVMYLGSLSDTIESKKSRIERKGWFGTQNNRALWIYYKKELEALEQELFEWTLRLDLRMVALPPEIKSIIDLDQTTSDHAPRLAARMRIDKYLKMPAAEKTKVQDELLIAEPNKEIEYFQTSGRRVTARFKTNKVIVEYKPHSDSLLTDPEALKSAFDTIRDLAASLSFVDPTVIGLLECTGYFHSEDRLNPRFGLVYKVPFIVPDDKPQSLKNILEAKDNKGRRRTAMHPLDARITLARRLAYALYFLHSVGWVHKAIRSNNILVLEPSNLSRDEAFPNGLGHPYLINFESARADTATTDLTMAEIEDQWHFNVYRHPARQGTNMSTRFTMSHDVYSLGVVLLEIGLWRPLEKYEKELKGKSPRDMRDELLKLAGGVAIQLGCKYRDLVIWCLSLDDGNLGMTSYVEHVLEKLEELVL